MLTAWFVFCVFFWDVWFYWFGLCLDLVRLACVAFYVGLGCVCVCRLAFRVCFGYDTLVVA